MLPNATIVKATHAVTLTGQLPAPLTRTLDEPGHYRIRGVPRRRIGKPIERPTLSA
jgi:hypothetical protein